ncbi:Uncharacterised protein [Enterobacter cloacae]|nr:Uncharacterised protein [Enterobacter cloacae]
MASARLWPSITSCPPLRARFSPAETALAVDDSVPPLLRVARVSLPLRVFVSVISFPAATLSAPLLVTLPPRCVRLPSVDSVVSAWPVSVASASAIPCLLVTVSAPPCADTPPPFTVRVSLLSSVAAPRETREVLLSVIPCPLLTDSAPALFVPPPVVCTFPAAERRISPWLASVLLLSSTSCELATFSAPPA